MTEETRSYVTEKTRGLMAAASCCPEARAAAAAWLDAAGTENEAAETKKYLAELEEDITSIDDLIAFASSEGAKAHFGEEGANGLLAHARQIKAQGAKFCDCPACAAALAILEKKAEML
jgi:hypothetical protein